MTEIEKQVEKFDKRGDVNTLEVTPYGQDPKWVMEQKSQDSFLATIERLARMPELDPVKLQQIMDMNERVLDRNAKQAFNAAMTKAQNKTELVVARSKNEQTHSMYAKLKQILIETKPIYTAEGFSLMFYEGDTPKENHTRVCVDIMHNQGHTEKRWGDFAVQTTGIAGKAMMTLIHGQGSTFSYGRRYLTCMIFNIPTGDDDDGNAGGGSIECVSKGEVVAMKKIIKDKKFDESLVMTYVKTIAGDQVDKLEDIPKKHFKEIHLALKNKKKKPQEKKEPQREPGCDDC